MPDHVGISEKLAGELLVEGRGSPLGKLWVREKGRNPATTRIVWMYKLTPEGRSHLGEYNPAERRLRRRLESARKLGIVPGDLVRVKRHGARTQYFKYGAGIMGLQEVNPGDVGIMMGWGVSSWGMQNSLFSLPDLDSEEDVKLWSGFHDLVPISLINGVLLVTPNHVLRKVKSGRT